MPGWPFAYVLQCLDIPSIVRIEVSTLGEHILIPIDSNPHITPTSDGIPLAFSSHKVNDFYIWNYIHLNVRSSEKS